MVNQKKTIIDQDKNLSAVFAFRSVARVKIANTVIVLQASVLYYDLEEREPLFNGETEVYIDTTQEDRVSIPALSYDNRCFCEFSTRYQDFSYKEGVLTITGTSNAHKHAYRVTLI